MKRSISLRRTASGCSGTKAGFSLMELIVVMAILAMLTAAVLPVFGSAMRGAKIDNGFQDIVATMGYAQDAAVSQGVEHRVYFDDKQNAYWIERMVGVERGDKVFELLNEHVGEWRQLPQGLEFDRISARRERGGFRYIAFYPTGARDEGEIRLRNTAENIRGYSISTKRSGRRQTLDGFDTNIPERR